ncbi:TPA: phage protease [Escherichia coli]
MNKARETSPSLMQMTPPRKIDLSGEKALLGVDVPDSLDLPGDMPVFLDYQARWFADESQVCIAEKSRRTGLTWAEAGRNVITAAKPKRRGGRNVFYVGSKQEMALEYISACALFSRAFNQLADADVYEQTFWDRDKKEEILTYMIRFPNSGFKIQALSSRPSNLRGLQGDVVIDEAAFHESLDELLKAAMALTMWGARVRIISTHNGVDNLFNQYIQEAREGRKDYSVHRITLDDAIADGLYRRICYVTDQEWSPESEQKWRDDLYKNAPTREDADEEYGCIPKKSGGAYIPHALIEMAMIRDIPILTFEAPDNFISRAAWLRESEVLTWCEEHLKPLLEKLNPRSRFSFGEDFARTGDLSCFVLLEITESLAKREVFRVELRNLPYAQQEQVMMYILTRVTGIKTRADAHDTLKTQVASLSAELETAKGTPTGGTIDLTKYVPVETYNALRTEYVALSAQHGSTTLEQLLDKAESEGRIFKSERGYMEGLGQQIGVAALSAQLDARQPVAALTTLQTDTVTVPDKKTATAALSAEDIAAAHLLGKTEAEFLKMKEEMQ